MRRGRAWSVAAILVCIVAVSCSGETVVQPKPGRWQGEESSFTVLEDGTITQFRFDTPTCEIELDDATAIESDEVTSFFRVNPEQVYAGGTDFSARAEFDSETSSSGTYNIEICGDMRSLSPPTDVTWTAEWQSP